LSSCSSSGRAAHLSLHSFLHDALPICRAPPRLPRTQADGLVGVVPGGRERLLGAARSARSAEALRLGAGLRARDVPGARLRVPRDRKSTRLNSSHGSISYAVFCLKKKT